jgi:hypothetical protein
MVIELMEVLITKLNGLHKKASIGRVGGATGSIVGSGLFVGGIIAAPFTGGLSLAASGAGLGIVGGGAAILIGTSLTEWKKTKKRLRKSKPSLARTLHWLMRCLRLYKTWRKLIPIFLAELFILRRVTTV